MQRIMSFLSGIFTGAIVGAAAAVLLAPASGEETREQLQNRADGIVADLKMAVADERKRLEAELEALKRGELQVS